MMGRGRRKMLIQVKPSHQASAATLLETFSYHRPGFDPKYHFSIEVFGRVSGFLPPNKKPFFQFLIKSLSWCSDGRQFWLKQALLVLADRVWSWKHDWVIYWRDLFFPIDKWWLYLLWTVTYSAEDLKAKQLAWVSCATHWFAGREKQPEYFLIFQGWMDGCCLPPLIELLIQSVAEEIGA